MERSVKERLVGATILGLFVVLIVPELLSGPKRAVDLSQASLPAAAEPIRSVTVDLATSKATADDAGTAAAVTEDVAAGASAPDPAPAAALGQPQQPAASPSAVAPPAAELPPAAEPPSAVAPSPPAAPPPAPPPRETGALPPSTAHHGWAAQLGSFVARANAERLERQLKAEGFSPSMSTTGTGLAVRYRVRVGPVADRVAAEKLVAQLKRAGHPATFVAP